MKDDKFIEDFTNTFDKASLNYENILVLGDLNYNMQDREQSSPLQSVCDIFDYSNLVKKETCFTKNASPTLIDVILTNKPSHCQNTTNFNCGLSDVHNIVSTQIKGRIPKINRDYITYRSYKNFDHEKYVEDLEKIDYVNIGNESDINSTYEIF